MGELCPRGASVAGVFDRVGGDASATVIGGCNPAQGGLTVTGGAGETGWLSGG